MTDETIVEEVKSASGGGTSQEDDRLSDDDDNVEVQEVTHVTAAEAVGHLAKLQHDIFTSLSYLERAILRSTVGLQQTAITDYMYFK